MDNVKNPLVSIVFTSYNHKEYLSQALESLINQTYDNIEIIVIDDCSTDGSQDLLRKYINHPKINLQLQTINSGSYVKASNFGASFANGEYILFAQCDDYAEPDQIEELVTAAISNPNVGVLFSSSNLVDKDNKFIACDFTGREYDFRKKCATDCLLTGLEMRGFLTFACVLPNLSAALISKKDYLKVNGLPQEFPRSADWAFWLNLAEITNFFYIRRPLNNFRQHDTTIRSKTKFDVYLLEIYQVLYAHSSKHNLQNSDLNKFKVGAGSIWFWYFLENPKAWILRFPSLLVKTSKMEKFSLFYLLAGFSKHLKERLNKKK